MSNPTDRGRYFILTTSCRDHPDWTPSATLLSSLIVYAKGQKEAGTKLGQPYIHWQWTINFSRTVRVSQVMKLVPRGSHIEVSRSDAVNDYVWKEDTKIEGTEFEYGKKPFRKQEKKDWDLIKKLAQEDRLNEIVSDVYVCNYNSLKRIAKDNMKPIVQEREIFCYWGATNCGKSHRAWTEAGLDAFPKISTTKFWDAYDRHEHVVIEEFRGQIDISSILTWTDKWPVLVEAKHGGTVFRAKKIWFTSNKHPRDWYPELDEPTRAALLRRFNKIIHFSDPLGIRNRQRITMDCDESEEERQDQVQLTLDDLIENEQPPQTEEWEQYINMEPGPSNFPQESW